MRFGLLALAAAAALLAQDAQESPSLSRMALAPFRNSREDISASLVFIQRIDAEGKRVERCSGYVSGTDEVTTAYECVEGAVRVEFLFKTGRTTQTTMAANWDRARNWVKFHVSAPEHALRRGYEAAVENGQELVVFSVDAALQHVSGTVKAKWRELPKVGPCFEIGAYPPASAVGGPVLNDEFEVVGILSSDVEPRRLGPKIAIPVAGIGENKGLPARLLTELPVR